MSDEQACPQFEHAGIGPQLIRLRCVAPGTLPQPVVAWLGGIEVGMGAQAGAVQLDEELELAVSRLPCVPPPALLRFAVPEGVEDLAPPLPLGDGLTPWRLLGAGAPEVEGLEVQNGVLRGVVLNAVNGLFAPVLSARVNGGPPRAVVSEPPRPRPDGSSSIRFALTLRVEDIGETGLTVEIAAQGVEAPLARWALAPLLPGAAEEAMASLLSRQRGAEHAAALRDARLRLDLDRGMAERDARFEAFAEHAMGLLLAGPGAEPVRVGPEDPRIEALRALVAGAVPPPPELPAQRVLPAGHPAYTLGWHPPEPEFRWMGPSGLVENPDPWRPVQSVLVRLHHVYGGGQPRLLASFDARDAPALLRNEGREVLVAADVPVAFDVLRLDSLSHGSPAREGVGDDARELSVAVAEVVFHYA
ncbi:hypothetical protein [Roseomonas sp. BN140053]|uniref:hypothetical protein n=1 Tax=Roseomonas sp. BN140053 TaxID=3391898 RepID=UPI0039EC9023